MAANIDVLLAANIGNAAATPRFSAFVWDTVLTYICLPCRWGDLAVTPRVPATTTGLKLRGISYLGQKFDLVLKNKKACFRAWPSTKAEPKQSKTTSGLKISTLGSNSFAPLSSNVDTCYPVGTSVRIIDSS